jgi:hypothetical protein
MSVTERQMEIIKAALDERELLERAYLDAIEEFSRSTMCGRSTSDAIRLLHNWKNAFQKMERP